MSNTTSAAAIIEKRVSTIMTETLIQESVMLGAVRDFSSQIGPGMDRLDIPLFNELAVQDVSESTAMTAQVINPSASQLNLDRHKAIPFSISRKAGEQAKIAMVPEALENGAKSLAAEIDDYMLGLIDAGASTAAPDHRIALTANDPLADLAAAKKLLDTQNVPKFDRFVVASPGFVESLLQTNNLIRVNEYGNEQPIQAGFVSRIYGFTILESSSSAVVDDGFHAFQRQGVAFGRQIQPELRTEEKALEMRTDYVLSHLYGGLVTDGTRMVVADADGA